MNSISATNGVQQALAIAAQLMSQSTQELAASLIQQTLEQMSQQAQAAAQASGKGLNLDVMV